MNDDDINVNTYDYDTIINDTVVSDTHSTSDPYVKRASVTTKMSRSDKLRSLAQQAHDDGDCVCCLPDPDTITITISREDGEWWHKNYEPAAYPSGGPWEAIRRVDAAIRAALEGEK